jgi:hypothetical protein
MTAYAIISFSRRPLIHEFIYNAQQTKQDPKLAGPSYDNRLFTSHQPMDHLCQLSVIEAPTTSGKYLFDLRRSIVMWAVCLNCPRDFSLFPSGSLLKRTWVISFNKLNSLLVYRSLHAILTTESNSCITEDFLFNNESPFAQKVKGIMKS